MSILEKGREYYELPDVTVLYITKSDFIGHKRGSYQIHRKAGGKSQSIDVGNGVHERYFNLKYSTQDAKSHPAKTLRSVSCVIRCAIFAGIFPSSSSNCIMSSILPSI